MFVMENNVIENEVRNVLFPLAAAKPEFYKKLGWTFEGMITKNEGGEAFLFSKNI